MTDHRRLNSLRLDDPMTVAMYAYGAFSVGCGLLAPSIAAVEKIALGLRPTALMAVVAIDPTLRPLLTIEPLLLVAALPVAIVTIRQITKQARPPVGPLRMSTFRAYATGLAAILIGIVAAALPTYIVDPTIPSAGARSAAISYLLSHIFSASVVCGAMFWGAQMFAVLGGFCIRIARRAP